MQLNELPPEILDHVLETLTAPGANQHPDAWCAGDICQARLVCKKWDSLATKYLFRRVTLRHESESGFQKWHGLVNNSVARQAARLVIVDTDLVSLEKSDLAAFMRWEMQGVYPDLNNALRRISDLSQVDAVQLNFTEACAGHGSEETLGLLPFESSACRVNMLTSVFEAIRARPATASPITSLALVNLQNMPNLSFMTSDLCKDVMKDVTRLKLHVVVEKESGGRPEAQLSCLERVLFEGFMHEYWLSPIEGHLTVLDIGFNECWATAPGYFDGRGLTLPNLKKLRLHNYTISHHDHFYWVLLRKTLRCLILDDCYIVSHLAFAKRDVMEWKLPLHDWVWFEDGAFGFDQHTDAVFGFRGTWEHIFNGIAEHLTDLVSFRTHYGEPESSLSYDDNELSPSHYIAFDYAQLPSSWRKADPKTGVMNFGDNDPDTYERPPGFVPELDYQLNMANQKERYDSLALYNLLQVVDERACSQQ